MSVVAQLVESGEITDPKSAKGRLLSEAAKLFTSRGYDRTTVRDLAAALGIQSGSLFHHFKTKEDILCAVMHDTLLISNARLQTAAESSDDLTETLRNLIQCELTAIMGETRAALTVLVHEWRTISEERRIELSALREQYEKVWRDNLNAAHNAGLLSVEPAILRPLLTGALAWTINWYNPAGDVSLDDLVDRALTMILKN